ncbi:hypothetical protein BK653_10920 [Pseudomonas brassicacearum]|nr:hypothetical protein BK653_10920 [Pseudomonas brassicacearum]
MRRHNDGGSLVSGLLEALPRVMTKFRVDTCGGFVQDQQIGLQREKRKGEKPTFLTIAADGRFFFPNFFIAFNKFRAPFGYFA